MSRLVLRLPADERPGAVPYVRLDAGGAVGAAGETQLALLPKLGPCIAVWPAEELTLLGLQLPAMPAARLQAALAGALEDRLLGEVSQQHLAAAPREADGSVRTAACCDRAALRRALDRLDHNGLEVGRVVPEPALLEPGWACLQRLDDEHVRVVWRDTSGEAGWLHLRADGGAATCPRLPLRILVEPGLEDLAEAWFGGAVEREPCDRGRWLARAAESGWDLRQFDLAPRAAAQRLWSSVREQAATPAWRRVAWLGATLVALELLGMNLHALQLRRRQADLERQLDSTVAQALPGTPALLDPSLQMRRALDAARLRAGAPTSDGLEVLMGEAARVLGGTRPLALDFVPGSLSLRLPPARAAGAAQRCSALGLACSASGDSLTVSAQS